MKNNKAGSGDIAGMEGGIFWQMVGDLKEVKEPSTGISGGRDCQTEGLACSKAPRSDPAWHVRCWSAVSKGERRGRQARLAASPRSWNGAGLT